MHGEELLRRGVGIAHAFGDRLRQSIHFGMTTQPSLRQRQNLRAGARSAALRTVGTMMCLDGLDQLRYALALRRNEFQYRRFGLGTKVPHRLVGALAVGLVHHHDVRDFQQTRLGRLNRVARTGIQDHNRRICNRGDLDLRLPDANGLQHDLVVRQRRQQPDGRRHRSGQSPKVSPGSDRADQHIGIVDVRGHSDPVAQ